MNWTAKYLQSSTIPLGKTKLTLSDPQTPNLYFEVRKKSRAFVFRRHQDGKAVSFKIGVFPDVTIAEARQIVRQLRKGDEALLPVQAEASSKGMTLDIFVRDYFTEFSQRHHQETSANLAIYQNHIRPSFGRMALSDISKLAVHRWINALVKKGFKNSTVNRIIVLFGQMLGLAEQLEVPGAPEKRKLGLKLLTVRPTHTVFLKPLEAARLIKAVNNSNNPDLADIVALLLLTGARKNEALKMQWEEVNLESNIWVVPRSKNGSPRYIQLCHSAHSLLAARKTRTYETALVFPNPATGRPYSNIFHSWDVARKRAGLPHLRVHDLRHSFASALVNAGVPLYDVQQLLGHSSIKTTQRYAHLTQDRLRSSVQCIEGVYGKV